MGSWFSNIHIRKNETATAEAVADRIGQWMAVQQYLPAASEQEADGVVAIVADGTWISVYSDLLSFEDPAKYGEIALALSAGLDADVLGISCFDSDYLYLNLINAQDKTDAWLGVGSAAGLGIKRRSSLAAWKKKVSDFAAFSEMAKQKYVCAEEFLSVAESCLALPAVRSCALYEYLKDFGLDKNAQFFYFKLPEDLKAKDPVRLALHMPSGMPCFIGKSAAVSVVNTGAESRGLSVYFLGSYVEKEEITFFDVHIARLKKNSSESIPIALQKVQLADGQWAYYYHDSGLRIPPKVDNRLPMNKVMQMECERSIIVRFVPRGNPRKILDITVVLVPDKNFEGQTGWNVWHPWGSKKAFIDHFNQGWKEIRSWIPDACPPILKEEDFD